MSLFKFYSIRAVFIRSILKNSSEGTKLEDKNFTNHQLQYLDKYRDKIYNIDCETGQSITYGEKKQHIRNVSAALNEMGLYREKLSDPQKKVAIIAKNSIHYFTLLMSIVGCNSVAVLMNPAATSYEKQKMLDVTKPELIFGDTEFLEPLRQSVDMPYVKKLISMDLSDKHKDISFDGTLESLLNHSDQNCPLCAENDAHFNETCLNIFSSGTTGLPKTVELTHRNMIASSNSVADHRSIKEDSTLFGFLPYFHIYGILICLFNAHSSGSQIVVIPKFEPIQFLEAIEKYKINHLHLVPPLAVFLVNYPDINKYDLSSVIHLTVAAAPLDKKIESRLLSIFGKNDPDFFIGQGYGLSEITGGVSLLVYHDKLAKHKSGSSGKVLTNVLLKVVCIDDRTKELGPNEVGELLVKGPAVMKGYIGINEDDPQSGFVGDGWLSTGDVGYYDDDGYIFISDRLKEMIKVDGFQVAPAEMEGLLLTNPNILDCAVVGVADERHGEIPRAYILKKKDEQSQKVTEEDILNFVEEKVSKYKHLKGGVAFVDEIPKTASGKILRKKFKQSL